MRRLPLLTFITLALAAPAAGQAPVVYRIAVTGTVENGLAPYIARALTEAEAAASSRTAQSSPSAIRRLMSEIARPGLRSFGQASVQFMIVWQR